MVLELLKSVQRMPLDSGEKFKCVLAVLGTHYWRRFRNFGGRLKSQAKTRLLKRSSSTSAVTGSIPPAA
jgi:hypothetical protein